MIRRLILVVTLAALVIPACSKEQTAPDHAFRMLSTSMKEGKPELVLEAFPPRYREDVTGLLRGLGEKMDPEIWDPGFTLVAKLVKVLDEKRDLLMKHPLVGMAMMGSDPEELDQQLDETVESFARISKSPLATVDGLKSIELSAVTEALLGGQTTGLREQAEQIASGFGVGWLLGDYETEIVSQGEGVATIRLVPPDADPTELDVKIVDGYWVSAELADGWEDQMTEARTQIADFVIEPEMKTQIVAAMGAIDGILDEALAAKNEGEIAQVIAKAMTLPEQLGLDLGG